MFSESNWVLCVENSFTEFWLALKVFIENMELIKLGSSNAFCLQLENMACNPPRPGLCRQHQSSTISGARHHMVEDSFTSRHFFYKIFTPVKSRLNVRETNQYTTSHFASWSSFSLVAPTCLSHPFASNNFLLSSHHFLYIHSSNFHFSA